MTDQPEALRLADLMAARRVSRWSAQAPHLVGFKPDRECIDAARLLREQHAEIERLRAQIKLYQWLRNGGGLCSKPVVAAIDAAMQERGIAQPVERTDGQQTARIKP